MHSWPAPAVPRLPGRGGPVRVHDTATGALQVAAPERRARLYACGITPYDATHLGHAATYIGFDLLVRAWRDAGHDVTYVQNVTDVDDPLLERAARSGEDWTDLARRQTDLFRTDMAALRVVPPDRYVAVTEAVDSIAGVVQRLKLRGATYELDRDVYFAVASDPGFGDVSHLPAADMRALSAERGGDPDRAGKKDPLDPLLWRAARPGEPSWPSDSGPGRPGWHVECTAIALEHLGSGFDVQGGGSDLVFPHHEMSAAQARAMTGEPFAQRYVHAGMVGYDGAKMSKSLGNLVLVSTLRERGVDPAAVRLALLAHHYRSDWEWTSGELAAAERRLATWRDAVRAPAGADAGTLLTGVRAALGDDLDAPRALAAVDGWAAATLGEGGDADAPALAAAVVDALLGVDLFGVDLLGADLPGAARA